MYLKGVKKQCEENTWVSRYQNQLNLLSFTLTNLFKTSTFLLF